MNTCKQMIGRAKRQGAPKDNKNAQRGDDPASEIIRLRCTEAQKKEWQECAKVEGVTLSKWIKAMLEQ